LDWALAPEDRQVEVEMTHNNSREDNMNQRNPDNSTFDREINAALAKYVAAEPRAGLEDRILANLRAERQHSSVRIGWRWLAAGVAAVVIVAALSLWKSAKPAPDSATHQPAMTQQADKQTGTRIVANHASAPVSPAESTTRKRPGALSAPPRQAGPRLDHFPSPRPLTEEEKLLVRYVQDFPREAVVIAKEQAEFEQKMERLGGDQPSGTNSDQPDQQER
jgi:hypothetical protein